jgi:hypothetical protein
MARSSSLSQELGPPKPAATERKQSFTTKTTTHKLSIIYLDLFLSSEITRTANREKLPKGRARRIVAEHRPTADERFRGDHQ